MNSILRGIWSGLIATSTMTTALFKFHESLPAGQKSPLPPAKLTASILKKFPAGNSLSSEAQMEATMTAHFGFGAATGILYALIAPRIAAKPVVKGAFYGLGVWGASYMGWIPAFGLKPQATKMTAQRNLMMVLAHVVWGTTLAYNEHEMRTRGHATLDGRKNRFLAN